MARLERSFVIGGVVYDTRFKKFVKSPDALEVKIYYKFNRYLVAPFSNDEVHYLEQNLKAKIVE